MLEAEVFDSRFSQRFLEANAALAGTGGHAVATGFRTLVQMAVECIEPCAWAAVTTVPSGKPPYSPAFSSPISQRADELQYQLSEGPCLEAALSLDVAGVADAEHPDVWVEFCRAIVATTPVRSVLSFQMSQTPEPTALNLYSPHSHGFTQAHRDEAASFAFQARTMILHARTAERAAHLEIALESNRDIATAVGILMAAQRITPGPALEMLKQHANGLRRKVREVARYVIEAGELPPLPGE